MDRQRHWEQVYATKAVTDVSWFTPHLGKSLELIDSIGLGKDACIIDVGGGASTLADDLLERGFRNITVLDISSAALETIKARLGKKAAGVT